jgi:PAS domain S-box-containing protein
MSTEDPVIPPGQAVEASAEELYEHAPCGYLSTLPDGLIVRVNQTFIDWIGLPRDVLVRQRRFQTLLTVGARMYYETHYAPLLQMQGFVNEIALEIRRPDGGTRPVVASARQVRSSDGTVTANRIALFDSTDRRRYERELLLARRAAERAAAELADADRRKNEFIAMLAHELRNPLAPIRNAVEIFHRSAHASDSVVRTAVMMRRQVAQMVRLVEDLLDVSRIGQEKLALRRVPVDLASVMHHAIETSEPLLHEAGVVFAADLPSAAIYADADAARLAQAVGNILNNAAKFTPRGGSVTLTLERNGSDALIRIRDTGIGIDADTLSRVFELFVQADASPERRDGLGIGLTLAKSLVERHDGQITVQSEGLGRGTEFVIRLPVLTEALTGVSRAFAGPVVEPQVTPRRVLVVDDNRDSAEMMAMLLGFSGHEIRLAHDGLEAVEQAAAFQPHVVLLDIGLPKLNGYEVAQRIRQQAGPQPALVALTGWGQDEDRRRSSAAGFDAHLVKPVDHDVLSKVIAEIPLKDDPGDRSS